MSRAGFWGRQWGQPLPILRQELIEVVAVASVRRELGLIEQALDAAIQTDLIGVPVLSDWPTHLPVQTAEQPQGSDARTQRQPARARPACVPVAVASQTSRIGVFTLDSGFSRCVWFHLHRGRSASAHGDSLSVIWITVTPVPVVGLLFAAQLNESTLLVLLGLVPLVRAVFMAVPRVIVLVVFVVVALVVLALPIFLVSLVPWFSTNCRVYRGWNTRRQRPGETSRPFCVPQSSAKWMPSKP